MLPRNRWPAALMSFLSECSTATTIEDVAVIALRSPSGYPVDGAVTAWIKQSLAAMRWRQAKGSTAWRRPAKA